MITEKPMPARPLESSPESAERKAVISSFPAFLKTQYKIKMEEIEDEKELHAAHEDITEYQFLITHHVLSESDNASSLRDMWRKLREIARQKEEEQNFSIFQRGIVTQVAIHQVFKELGFNPRFSRPKHDAFKKIDLWSDAKHAVQVKGSACEKFGIFETDEIGLTPVEISEDGKTKKLFDNEFRLFKTKLKSFGNDVKGYFIVIPSDKIDFTTGKPSKELIDLIRQKISPQKKAA